MEKRLTKKDLFARMIEVLGETVVEDKDALIEFAQKEIDALATKAEKSKSYKRKKTEDPLKDAILTCLGSDEFRVTSDIVADLVTDFSDVTAAKVTARLTALVKEGSVEKEDVKVDKRTLKGYKLV